MRQAKCTIFIIFAALLSLTGCPAPSLDGLFGPSSSATGYGTGGRPPGETTGSGEGGADAGCWTCACKVGCTDAERASGVECCPPRTDAGEDAGPNPCPEPCVPTAAGGCYDLVAGKMCAIKVDGGEGGSSGVGGSVSAVQTTCTPDGGAECDPGYWVYSVVHAQTPCSASVCAPQAVCVSANVQVVKGACDSQVAACGNDLHLAAELPSCDCPATGTYYVCVN